MSEQSSGASADADQALAVPVEPASGLAPSGFDPSRGATLNVGADAYSPFWRHTIVAEILDVQEGENGTREDFKPAVSREMAEAAINALFGLYDCRSSDFAAAYGWTGLWSALGIDWMRGIPFHDASAIEAATAGETRQGLDPKDESAVPQADAIIDGESYRFLPVVHNPTRRRDEVRG
jgi:hypothetical protein